MLRDLPESGLTDDLFVDYLIALVTTDRDFLALYADDIVPETFQRAEIAWLVRTAVNYFTKYGEIMPEGALALELEAKPEQPNFEKEMVVQLYGEQREITDSFREFLYQYAAGWFQRRMLFATLDEAAARLADGRVVEAHSFLSDAVNRIGAVGADDDGLAWPDDVENFLDLYLNRFVYDESAIKTGWQTVDEVLRGGLRGGELGVIMGGPGSGKTQSLCWLARAAAQQGKNVVYFTLEVDQIIVNQRFWAGVIDMSTNEMDKVPDDAVRLMKKAAKQARKDNWGVVRTKQYPSKAATVSTLAGYLSFLESRKEFVPDLIIVDYADILATPKSYDVRRDELATVYEDLRGLGQLYDLPIWTASQANREGFERGTLRMNHIADSWDKAKIADYILGICTSPAMKEAGEIHMAPIKVRNNSDGGFILMEVDYGRSILRDMGWADVR